MVKCRHEKNNRICLVYQCLPQCHVHLSMLRPVAAPLYIHPSHLLPAGRRQSTPREHCSNATHRKDWSIQPDASYVPSLSHGIPALTTAPTHLLRPTSHFRIADSHESRSNTSGSAIASNPIPSIPIHSNPFPSTPHRSNLRSSTTGEPTPCSAPSSSHSLPNPSPGLVRLLPLQ